MLYTDIELLEPKEESNEKVWINNLAGHPAKWV